MSESLRENNVNNKLVIITNIPSPYRLHLFQHLFRELSGRGVGFKVLFMAKNERPRHWSYRKESCNFPHRLLPGIHPYFFGLPFHFNPAVLIEIMKIQPRWLIVGGSWIFPTAIFLLIFRFLYPKTKILLWMEIAQDSSRYDNCLLDFIRWRIIPRLTHAFVVPGRTAGQIISRSLHTQKPILRLRNLVDEKIFRDQVHKLRQQREALRGKMSLHRDDFVILLPVRLLETQKGIINFLNAIKEIKDKRLVILIAGDGPDKKIIARWIGDNKDTRAYLLGYGDKERIVELYALCDLVCLPSFKEPYGFVTVEALWAGLPLIVSWYCGSSVDVVKPGYNGWTVDPKQPQTIKAAVEEAISFSTLKLRDYGLYSLSIAQEDFSTDKEIERFCSSLLTFGSA